MKKFKEKRHKVDQYEQSSSSDSNTNTGWQVAAPDFLRKLGIDLSSFLQSSAPNSRFDDGLNQFVLNDGTVTVMDPNKDGSSILETATLMKKSVLLSPTFHSVANGVDGEPVSNIVDKTIIGGDNLSVDDNLPNFGEKSVTVEPTVDQFIQDNFNAEVAEYQVITEKDKSEIVGDHEIVDYKDDNPLKVSKFKGMGATVESALELSIKDNRNVQVTEYLVHVEKCNNVIDGDFDIDNRERNNLPDVSNIEAKGTLTVESDIDQLIKDKISVGVADYQFIEEKDKSEIKKDHDIVDIKDDNPMKVSKIEVMGVTVESLFEIPITNNSNVDVIKYQVLVEKDNNVDDGDFDINNREKDNLLNVSNIEADSITKYIQQSDIDQLIKDKISVEVAEYKVIEGNKKNEIYRDNNDIIDDRADTLPNVSKIEANGVSVETTIDQVITDNTNFEIKGCQALEDKKIERDGNYDSANSRINKQSDTVYPILNSDENVTYDSETLKINYIDSDKSINKIEIISQEIVNKLQIDKLRKSGSSYSTLTPISIDTLVKGKSISINNNITNKIPVQQENNIRHACTNNNVTEQINIHNNDFYLGENLKDSSLGTEQLISFLHTEDNKTADETKKKHNSNSNVISATSIIKINSDCLSHFKSTTDFYSKISPCSESIESQSKVNEFKRTVSNNCKIEGQNIFEQNYGNTEKEILKHVSINEDTSSFSVEEKMCNENNIDASDKDAPLKVSSDILKSKLNIHGVEKPGGDPTYDYELQCPMVTKTYSRKPARKNTSIILKFVENQNIDLFQLADEIDVRDLCHRSQFCICNDFGSLAYYDCEMLYEHIHFWLNKEVASKADKLSCLSSKDSPTDINDFNVDDYLNKQDEKVLLNDICWYSFTSDFDVHEMNLIAKRNPILKACSMTETNKTDTYCSITQNVKNETMTDSSKQSTSVETEKTSLIAKPSRKRSTRKSQPELVPVNSQEMYPAAGGVCQSSNPKEVSDTNLNAPKKLVQIEIASLPKKSSPKEISSISTGSTRLTRRSMKTEAIQSESAFVSVSNYNSANNVFPNSTKDTENILSRKSSNAKVPRSNSKITQNHKTKELLLMSDKSPSQEYIDTAELQNNYAHSKISSSKPIEFPNITADGTCRDNANLHKRTLSNNINSTSRSTNESVAKKTKNLRSENVSLSTDKVINKHVKSDEVGLHVGRRLSKATNNKISNISLEELKTTYGNLQNTELAAKASILSKEPNHVSCGQLSAVKSSKNSTSRSSTRKKTSTTSVDSSSLPRHIINNVNKTTSSQYSSATSTLRTYSSKTKLSSNYVEDTQNPIQKDSHKKKEYSYVQKTTSIPTRDEDAIGTDTFELNNSSTSSFETITMVNSNIEIVSPNTENIVLGKANNERDSIKTSLRCNDMHKSIKPSVENNVLAASNETESNSCTVSINNKTILEFEIPAKQSVKHFKCAVCKQVIVESKWIAHIGKEHNYLAWKHKEQPLDLENDILVMEHLRAIVKKIGPLTCNKCGIVRKHVKVFLRHIKTNCIGKDTDNIDTSVSSLDLTKTQEDDDTPLSKIKHKKRKLEEKPVIVCGVCYENIRESSWIEHIRVAHKYLAWKSGEMPLNINDEDQVKTHLQNISKQCDGLLCYKCDAKWKYVKKYWIHLSLCDGTQRPRPSLENMKANKVAQSNDGITAIHIDKPIVKCGVCGEEVDSKDWVEHIKLTHNYLAWIEGQPPLDFDNDVVLNNHLKEVLNTVGELVCTKCGVIRKFLRGFLLHMKACEASGFKLEIVEPVDLDSDQFECGVCKERGNVKNWKHHAMSKHYNIAWRTGELPINLRNFYAVEKYLKEYKLKHKLCCKQCGGSRVSAFGFYAHIMTCGKTDAEIDAVHNVCDICHNKYLCVYRTQHMAIHKEQEYRKEVKEVQEQKKMEFMNKSQNPNVTSGRRRAAEKAKLVIEKYSTEDGKNVCPCGTMFKHALEASQHSCSHKEQEEESDCEASIKMEPETEDESIDSCDDNLSDEAEDGFAKTKKRKRTHQEGPPKVTRVPFKVDCYSTYLAQGAQDFFNMHYSARTLFGGWRNSSYTIVPEDEVTKYLPPLLESCRVKVCASTWTSYKRFEGRKERVLSIFSGSAIQCMGWVPHNLSDESGDNYLSVVSHTQADTPRLAAGELSQGPALLQIWQFGTFTTVPKMVLGLAFDYGLIWSIDWCPSGARDLSSQGSSKENETRLGLLAIACSNGSSYIFAVPYPPNETETSIPVYKLKPVAELRISSSPERLVYQATSIFWSHQKGHDIVIVGYSDGTTALYDLSTQSPLLKTTDDGVTIMYPFQDKLVENSAITGVGVCATTNRNHPIGGMFSASTTGGTMSGWPTSAPTLRCHQPLVNATMSTLWPSVLFSGESAFSQNSVNEMEWLGGGRRVGASRAGGACARCARLAVAAPPALRLMRHHPCHPDLKKMIVATLIMAPVGQKRKRKENDDISMVVEPLTYEDAVAKYGLDFSLVSKKEQGAAQKLCSKNELSPERYPLSEMTAVAFCPSKRFHERLAVATHAGVIFVMNT